MTFYALVELSAFFLISSDWAKYFGLCYAKAAVMTAQKSFDYFDLVGLQALPVYSIKNRLHLLPLQANRNLVVEVMFSSPYLQIATTKRSLKLDMRSS
ncbi:hypothetical protein BCT16_14850 [Vibrio sp. 10N.222.54.B6]|nr:hypothetical protein BCU05_17210 [Vibrio sp. 10N.261.54.C3]PMN96571.1 hypothetical protein BCT20_02070 [Vibrio sp. 10N.222.55.C12]PMO17510.1 hypothetical protein BCT16_14850 [Vibrio sp. 10N.222.54.B6]